MHFTLAYGGTLRIKATATAIHAPGDIVTYGGFTGAYLGQRSCAVGDVIEINLDAVGDVKTASGVTFASGAAVFWDTVNKTAVTGAGANIVKLGTAIVAKVSGQLVTRTLLNTYPG